MYFLLNSFVLILKEIDRAGFASLRNNLNLKSSLLILIFVKYSLYIIGYWTLTLTLRGRSRAATTSKMECFVITVDGWKPLTIITKHSILDNAAFLDPTLTLVTLTLTLVLYFNPTSFSPVASTNVGVCRETLWLIPWPNPKLLNSNQDHLSRKVVYLVKS